MRWGMPAVGCLSVCCFVVGLGVAVSTNICDDSVRPWAFMVGGIGIGVLIGAGLVARKLGS